MKAALIDARTEVTEPVCYLGAVGLLALTGIAAIFGAPSSGTHRKPKPVPPVRHPTEW